MVNSHHPVDLAAYLDVIKRSLPFWLPRTILPGRSLLGSTAGVSG
ncbi:MAG: hypothetical protein U5K99_01435 [Anaerolineales bacterium]|nr:hypothetical protein [Anaerolineales bacterium]